MTVKWTMATPCVLALSVLALLLSVSVKAASFDCGKARTATEIAICRDSSLGRLDEQIAELYASLRSASVSSERSKLLKAQRRFLQNRNSCGGSLSCLRNRYDSRLADLCNLASVKRLDAAGTICSNEVSTMQSASTHATDNNDLDYATVASLPCLTYLKAYGTVRFDSMKFPIAEYISEKDTNSPPDKSLGSSANITDYMLTECRLNETYRIGEAVFSLFEKQESNRLPRIPIGGATQDPQAQAEWDAFDNWIHHRGRRPKFKAE
jgi:uncharacterized protein